MANAQTNKCLRARNGQLGELSWFQAKRKRTRRLNVLQRASRKANR